MKHLLYITLLLLTTLSACQPEVTNEPQVYMLCPNYNTQYYYIHNGDTARCWVPNAFTPSGFPNRTFSACGYNIDPMGSVVIKDGDVVVYQNDTIIEHHTIQNGWYTSTKGWDGKINGEYAPRKNYSYTISGKDVFGNAFALSGNVSIIDSIGNTLTDWNTVKINCDSCSYGNMWNEQTGNYDTTDYPQLFLVGGECR